MRAFTICKIENKISIIFIRSVTNIFSRYELLKRYLLVSALSALTILVVGIFKAWSAKCDPCYLSALVGSAMWLLIFLIINCLFFLMYIHPANKVLKYVTGITGSLLPPVFLMVSLFNYHASGHNTEFEIVLPSFVLLFFGSRTLFDYLDGRFLRENPSTDQHSE